MIARAERPSRATRRTALAASRAQGCVCRPEIMSRAAFYGIPRAAVHHDEWCPLLRVKVEQPRREPQLVIEFPPTRDRATA